MKCWYYEKVLSPGSSGWKCIDMCKIRRCNGHVTGSPWEHAAKAGTGGAMWDVKTFEPMAFWIIREREREIERERAVLMGFTMILPKVNVDRTTPHVVHFIRRLCILCKWKLNHLLKVASHLFWPWCLARMPALEQWSKIALPGSTLHQLHLLWPSCLNAQLSSTSSCPFRGHAKNW